MSLYRKYFKIGRWHLFDNFYELGRKSNVQSSDYHHLKENFSNFLIKYTNINKVVETRRIFSKVLNPLSAKYSVQGTKSGRLSQNSINFSDLLYNQKNFRDSCKEKKLTRKEADELIDKSQKFLSHQIKKASKQISSYHISSEMDGDSAYDGKTDSSYFYETRKDSACSTFENLINLTPNQHRNKAHQDQI